MPKPDYVNHTFTICCGIFQYIMLVKSKQRSLGLPHLVILLVFLQFVSDQLINLKFTSLSNNAVITRKNRGTILIQPKPRYFLCALFCFNDNFSSFHEFELVMIFSIVSTVDVYDNGLNFITFLLLRILYAESYRDMN